MAIEVSYENYKPCKVVISGEELDYLQEFLKRKCVDELFDKYHYTESKGISITRIIRGG